MGKDLNHPVAREIFGLLDNCTDKNFTKVMWSDHQDDEAVLRQTDNAQPAILAHSMAVWSILDKRLGEEWRETTKSMMGHSLGEYSALLASSLFSLHDALDIVIKRGKLMKDVGPSSHGGMCAFMGHNVRSIVKKVIEEQISGKESHFCEISNYNSPTQVVVSGKQNSLDELKKIVKTTYKSSKIKSKQVAVSCPFHCGLMKESADKLYDYFSSKSFHSPLQFPSEPAVIANLTGEKYRWTGLPDKDTKSLFLILKNQVTFPVLWNQSVEYVVNNLGITNFVEVGPGTILSSLIKQTFPSANTRSIGTMEEIDSFCKDFENQKK
eukprot:CAMPEP_0174271516 /NCGR_PEP_ID=MMETSP0439-20130205/48140_1 /TAXON_ID=0 /ORGANISM="Stereomyxa ramosa, Strain Chinc5" /LENGTH=323 /DNA_ID=CAMNT_0015361565 /DNA_START=86 /DNA_END=1057 /DNA_ORIENTATION=+